MTQKEKIAKILTQKSYKVEKGRILRYDVLDDKFKPVPVSGNRIPLVRDGSVVEIFDMTTVFDVIDGLDGGAEFDDRGLTKKIHIKFRGKDGDESNRLIIDEFSQYSQITTDGQGNKEEKNVLIATPIPDFKGVRGKKIAPKKKKAPVKKSKKNPTPKKSNAQLRSKEIKYIRDNYLSISINKMAKELGITRHPVMYVVKQIKAGKTLKYENA